MAAHAGGPVVCLSALGDGRTYRLYDARPGPELNERIPAVHAYVVSSDDGILDVESADETPPALIRVDIRGPIEQRAGFHDVCGGWSDGHDAIAERLTAALQEGDVLLVIDSPGGAHAGLQAAIDRVVAVKEEYGRRVTVYADEMIGSAAYWWAAVIGDEIWGPEAMLVGSVGARAAHCSIAGALEKEGSAVTYFAWPGPGKVAFAPELPLSEEGKRRGDRDVSIAGEAFAAAVGPRRGLSRDDIVALDADALSGQAAVDAKLADGVASFEDVTAYALSLAGGGEDGTMPEIDDALKYEKKTTERYEETEPEKDPDDPDGDEEEEDDEEEGAEADDAADPPPSAPPPPKKKMTPPPPERAKRATVEGLLGLRPGASLPAIKGAALPRLTAYASACARLGIDPSQPDAFTGALHAVMRDAADAPSLRSRVKTAEQTADAAEREKILDAMVREGKHERGEVWRTYAAKETGEKKRAPREWCGPVRKNKSGEKVGMSLGSLRSYAKNATVKNPPAAPFQPIEDGDPMANISPPAAASAAKFGVKADSYAAAEKMVNAAANGAARGVQIVRQ